MTTMALPTPTTHCFVEGEKPLYLDHYRAEGEGFHPCVLFAFGGGFSHGNRADARYMPYFEMLLKEGFDVVSIDYRLGMAYTLDKNEDVGPLEGAWAMYSSVNDAAEDVLRATQYIIHQAVKMKIDTSKVLIREGKYNISQISFYLGFDSIHTFSRTFKKITGMTPTEFRRSCTEKVEEMSLHGRQM